jgi:hypothetical protein
MICSLAMFAFVTNITGLEKLLISYGHQNKTKYRFHAALLLFVYILRIVSWEWCEFYDNRNHISFPGHTPIDFHFKISRSNSYLL